MVSSQAKEMISQVWVHIDEKKTVDLLTRLIETPSPTGSEGPCAELLAAYMEKHGIQVTLQEVEEGRRNVIGMVKGDGSGPRLFFNGHLDTSFTGRFQEDYAMAAELANALRPKATLEDGIMYGLGARNMKGGVAAMVLAISALADSGIKLKGDVAVAGVVGEIERSPVQGLLHRYDGKDYRGCGIGMRHLLEHGFTADYGITAEPTSNKVCRGRVGFLYARVTTKGLTAYSPFKTDGLGDNAIRKMASVVSAIEDEFGPNYARAHTYDMGPEDGKMVPQVSVGGIEGGLPFKPNYVPAICCSYVDIFFTPQMEARQAVGELKAFLHKLGRAHGIEVEVEPYLIHGPASETPANNYIVRTCKEMYEYTTGEKHTAPSQSPLSISDDTITTRVYEIPSVTWGPSAPPRPDAIRRGEYVSIREVTTAARMFAATLVEVCSREKKEAV